MSTAARAGQQGDGFPVGSLDPQPAQSDRQLRIALAGKAHLVVLEHGEIVALGGCDKARADVVEAHVGLGPGDEDRALVSDCGPPAVVAIPLVKDIARPRLDRQRATDLGVVNIGIGNVEDARIIGLRVKDDMELQAANAPVRLAHSHSLPSGMGVASISLTIAAPSCRVCRSSWLASRLKVSAKRPTGRRLFASDSVERTSGPAPRW